MSRNSLYNNEIFFFGMLLDECSRLSFIDHDGTYAVSATARIHSREMDARQHRVSISPEGTSFCVYALRIWTSLMRRPTIRRDGT